MKDVLKDQENTTGITVQEPDKSLVPVSENRPEPKGKKLRALFGRGGGTKKGRKLILLAVVVIAVPVFILLRFNTKRRVAVR